MQAYSKRYFEAFVKLFEKELKEKGWTITYEELISPQYYNYVNDQIWVLITGCEEKEFDEYFEGLGKGYNICFHDADETIYYSIS